MNIEKIILAISLIILILVSALVGPIIYKAAKTPAPVEVSLAQWGARIDVAKATEAALKATEAANEAHENLERQKVRAEFDALRVTISARLVAADIKTKR